MNYTAQTIAQLIGGRIEGDANACVSDFAKIEQGREGCISFLANPKYESYIYDCPSTIVLVADSFVPERPVKATLIRVANPYEAVAKLMQVYQQMQPQQSGVSSLAFVADTAKIGERVTIEPFAFIGENAIIGDDTVIHSHVCIYHDCHVGKRCILHAGCVIGADGFGFAPTPNGYEKIPQLGNVIIEDDVEVGANTCIDRSTMGSTIVHSDVKLDNLVQLAHNTEVGSHTVMSAQVGVAGSTKIGEWCTFGGQSGVSGHANIASHTTAAGKTGIINSIRREGMAFMGTPAIEFHNFYRSSAVFKQLPDVYRQMNQMRKELDELKQKLNNAETKNAL